MIRTGGANAVDRFYSIVKHTVRALSPVFYRCRSRTLFKLAPFDIT
jgi:hypothetical protein